MAALIRSDADLLEIALGYFDDFAMMSSVTPNRNPQQQHQPSALVDSNPLSPSVSAANRRGNNNKTRQDYEALGANYDYHDHSRRRAERWLHVLEQHNRDFTFAPAICQRSVDIARGKMAEAHLHEDVVARLYSDDLERRRENEAERELQAEANRMMRQHQIIHQHNVVVGGSSSNTPTSALTAQSGSVSPAAGQRASERLYRQASQVPTYTPMPVTPRGFSATATSRRVTPRNSHHQSAIQQQQQPTTPTSRPDDEGNNGGGDSPVAAAPPQPPQPRARSAGISSSSQNQHARNHHAAVADPALFAKLYEDAERLRLDKEQRAAEARHIEMKKMDADELEEMLERVTTQALEERAEHNAHLKAQFGTNRFHPTIDERSVGMVSSRNAAAGDVYHRLYSARTGHES